MFIIKYTEPLFIKDNKKIVNMLKNYRKIPVGIDFNNNVYEVIIGTYLKPAKNAREISERESILINYIFNQKFSVVIYDKLIIVIEYGNDSDREVSTGKRIELGTFFRNYKKGFWLFDLNYIQS